MMKNIFPGYYRLSDSEMTDLWKNCTFVLDANVLLNLYRYPEKARNDLLQVLEQIADRLWVPHQAAFEYQVNRLSVIAEQVRRFNDVRKVLTNSMNSLRNGLEDLQLTKRHSVIDPDGLLEKTKRVFDEFTQNLDTLEQKQPDVFANDTLREQIDNLLEGKVGLPTASQEVLEDIYRQGKTRYENRQPPGYEDANKGKQSEKQFTSHISNGLVIRQEYGDLIVWFQIIEAVKSRRLTHIIFVTDDEKEDWWWIVESKGKKIIGPRPELVEEILAAGASSFYMYNSERFLVFAGQYLGVQVEQESIIQVREITELRKDEFRGSGSLKTPQSTYRVPILSALVKLGGEVNANAVLGVVQYIMADQLTAHDLETLADGKTIRWRNTAQWACNTLREEGLIRDDTPRGVWGISEAGRKWLKAQTGGK